MIRVRAYAPFFVLLAACGGDSDHKGPNPKKVEADFFDSLRRCKLLGAGKAQGMPISLSVKNSAVASCEASCLDTLGTSCEELEVLACQHHYSDRFTKCLVECGNIDVGCNDHQGTYRVNQECDGHAQCQDRSDEQGCFPITGVCDDGTAIQSSRDLWCDGASDCDDGSDELGCLETRYCKNGTSIPPYELCNGENFCADGEDEENCANQGGFACKDGSGHVSDQQVCDLWEDCADGSDEAQGCAKLTCSEQDPTDNCPGLANGDICDGIRDCADGSDEQGCDFGDGDFGDGDGDGDFGDGDGDFGDGDGDDDVFVCDDGTAIPPTFHCDLTTDCPDGEDEIGCPDVSEPEADGGYKCNDGTDIWDDYKCDGAPDCVGGEDEVGCDTPVDPTKFKCADGKLIDQDEVCDQFKDCVGGEDEANCTPVDPTTFRCNDGEEIDQDWVCDQVEDCVTGEDEVGCPTTDPEPDPEPDPDFGTDP
jgi:hypothetical protein